MKRWGMIGIVGLALLAACGSSDPARQAVKGDPLFTLDFATPGAWEEGAYPAGDAAPVSILETGEGRYEIWHRAEGSSSFTWGQGGDAAENVIIEVDAEQLSIYKNNLYGVACRLATDERGEQSGYVLLISGDGHYGIAELQRRTLNFVLEWRQSGEIRQGRAANTIRAVCVDDYLAVYVNGKFLGDVKDDTYRRAGQVGLVAGVTGGEEVRIAFDNLAVYEGMVSE